MALENPDSIPSVTLLAIGTTTPHRKNGGNAEEWQVPRLRNVSIVRVNTQV
jgi:hypothetical protein